MICTPVSESCWVFAVSAIAPPAAWRARAMKSELMNIIEMRFGVSQV